MKLPTDVPAATGRPFIDLAREIVAAIMRIVEEGWNVAVATSNVAADDGEVEMTERLRDGMREAANRRTLGMRLIVLPGTESRSGSGRVRPDGRTDVSILVIEVFLRFGDHDPHAIIECKRIAGSDSRLCREYVFEGIDRFGSGKYGARHATGFMIGYLVAGNATDAVRGINRVLNARSRSAETLKPSSLVGASWAWQSEHPRGGGEPIELQHVFLAFAMTSSG